jgi:hypothetical protein
MIASKVKHILQYLQKTDEALSRTVQNRSVATAASAKKQPALLAGKKLTQQIDQNRELVAEYVGWKQKYTLRSTEDFLSSILTIAEISGLNLFPRSSFRQWDYPGTHGLVFNVKEVVAPSQIFPSLITLVSELSDRMAELGTDSELGLRIVAGTEWDIAIGPIHPFYDGCGRISRYFSTLLCLSFSLPMVWRGSREDYFSPAVLGRNEFVAYFASCRKLTLSDDAAEMPM